MFNLKKILGLLLFTSIGLFAQQSGTYHTLTPSRDGKLKQIVEIGEKNGTKTFRMASCKSCVPVSFIKHDEASSILGKTVYMNSMGMHVLPYDNESFVVVAPKKHVFGEGAWDGFYLTNFLSTNKTKVSAMTKAKVEAWATQLSKKAMSGDLGNQEVNNDSNIFHAMVKVSFGGDKHRKVKVTHDKKKFVMRSLDNYKDEYNYMPELSKAIGFDVYQYDRSRRSYVVLNSSASIVWLKFGKGDFGNSKWDYDGNVFNHFHKNPAVNRKILSDYSELEKEIAGWVEKANVHMKKVKEDRNNEKIKNTRLPNRKMRDAVLEKQALVAAKNWAKRYRWKETITKVYFTAEDWVIYRNKLTGAQLGRRISGVIVMKRPDGKCSFHYASFAQQYNGSGYQKVFTEGITPGQNIIKCEHTR